MRATDLKHSLQIPDGLRQQFSVLERRLWWVDTIIAICGACSGLVVSYVLLFLSDRFWDTPQVLRVLFTLAGLGVSAWFVTGWLRLWVWRRRDLLAMSNLVQGHHRRLGDRLLGIVELADEEKRPANISAALCRAAIQQVSAEAARFDFRLAVATRKPKMYFIAAILLVGLGLAPWFLVREASWNAFARWIWPVSSTPRYTFVSIDQLPGRMIVPHGEAFEIACSVRLHPFWKPDGAVAQFDGQPAIQTRILANQVLFKIPGQTKNGRLALRIGDVRRDISVEPMFRPALKRLMAQVQFPDYLQYPDADDEVRNGKFAYLEGSRVTFKGRASRALANAEMRTGTNEMANSRPVSLNVAGEVFQTRSLTLDGIERAAFSWKDELGLASAAPWVLALQPQKDGAPEVECPDQAAVVAMLEDEMLEIRASAQDDYGLRELGVSWVCQKRQETNLVAREESKIAEGAPKERKLAGTYKFSPARLHVPPDTFVTLRATASDYFPGRKRAESFPHRIYILSKEEHARLVQEEFEKLLAEVEELTRRQEGLNEATKETKNQPPDKLKSDETTKKLGEQANEQSAIGEKLKNLAQKGANTLKEALRNDSIPTDQIKEWAQNMEAMKNIAASPMAQASQALAQAQQKPGERPEQVEQASEKEDEALKKLQELQKKMGPDLDRMLANTLAQRLRKVSRTEKGIGETLQKIIPEIIGVAADQLPKSFLETTLGLAKTQDLSQKEAQGLQEEVSRFFDRTSADNYGKVTKEMKETQVVEELTRTADLIRQNVAAQAMAQTETWTKHFAEWADALEPKKDSGGGGGGGGGGSPNEAALLRMLALLRLRQAEINLREHTDWLEQNKPKIGGYREDSKILSVRQSLMMDDVEMLQSEKEGKYLPQVHEAMSEAETFLNKPQTDKPTVSAETDAVNMLEAEIMEMMKQGESQGAGGQMAMLMQMMGMGQGASPGGSMAGGTTDQANAETAGNKKGGGSEQRNIEKAAGRDTRPLPAEFREALQNYYKAIEQISP